MAKRVEANRELIGLGTANIVAVFYGGMPIGGGLSRSATNVAAGAQNPLASIVAGVFILCIVIAAISMIDVSAYRQSCSYDRADGLAWAFQALGQHQSP